MSRENHGYDLVQKIRDKFRTRIIPKNILYVFHKYDVTVLSRQDIQKVEAEIKNEGDIQGATVLLERLSNYNNWFPCLIKVLRDPSVKQAHLAKEMEKDEAELQEQR